MELKRKTNKVMLSHKILLEGEIYELKFKDKIDRSGFEIKAKGKSMKLSKIQIVKVPGENNQIKVKLFRPQT